MPIINSYNTRVFVFKRATKNLVVALICFLFFASSVNAKINEAARYEIDAKRIGVKTSEKDALPRSREFIRLDSTYYVGWMYEGLYRYEHCGDYLGYKQTIAPLYKALQLFEKDFGFKIKNIFSSIDYFRENDARFGDFYAIVNTLELCYNSIEMPDSTMALLQKIEGYHFQRDFFRVNCDRSWLYHRNRFFNSSKYSFLKNSIEENEKMAFKECYNQISAIYKNKEINDYWYGPYQSKDDLFSAYHYLALLHDYNQNYDSAQYYYQLLINGDRVSWSNYANMKHEIGDFAGAVENYSKKEYKRKFSLIEADYYMPMIYVYGGKTKEAIAHTQNRITESGSTPGFGWYTIALARGYLYDGQLDSCDFYLDKAANFKELHINTTLTQSQYEFTINLLRVQVLQKKVAQVKFFNKGWWYSFSDIFTICSLKLEKVLLEYALVNALASNEERDRIVYDLFCSETTVSFDESMYLLQDFCLPYFEKKYENYVRTDPRKKVNRYFRLFALKFAFENGETEKARKEAEILLQETVPLANAGRTGDDGIDVEYEKLYTYRLLEILAQLNKGTERYDMYKNACFEVYPQLMLYSGMAAKMNVSFSGLENDDVVQSVISDVKDCDIEFGENNAIPKAKVQFFKKGETYRALINVWDQNQKPMVINGELIFKKEDNVGKELAMRLLGKGGAVKL